jgi:hypothetical protein
MPTLPAGSAAGLPDGVETDSVVWDEVIDLGQYAIHPLPRGTTVHLTDLEREAVRPRAGPQYPPAL